MVERVAVTGVGMITALGSDRATTFERLMRGVRGFRPVSLFDTRDTRAKIAAEVPGLDVAAVAPAAELADWSRTDALGVIAAREAFEQSGAAQGRLGICLGGTTGGMFETEEGLLAGPLDRIDPERAKRLLSHPLDLTTSRIAAALGGATRTSTVCAACASSALAIAEAIGWLVEGSVDVVLAGGADGLCRLTLFGFDSLGALDPEPCRPFDAGRHGLGLGEGAGFLCLERESSARARGAQIIAFLSGAAAGAEAHHITHPEPSGVRAAELIRGALTAAGLTPADLDYVNAHGTGTEQNDAMEARALHRALGERVRDVYVSSSKAQVGHTLGAAGALEAAITVLALESGSVPPTVGLVNPEDGALRHVTECGVRAPLRAAASCSFGFGGTGAVLVFEAPDAALRARRSVSADPARVTSSDEPLVVSGAAAAGPFGVLGAAEAVRAVLLAPPAAGGPLAVDPLAALDPERSRRFDRAAAFVTLLAERALGEARLGASGVGLAAGTAFGSVERSVRFVLRAAERGVRRANPAEFPHLVASAASGNASIYVGLTGPAFNVAAGTAGGEAAVVAALAVLAQGGSAAFVAGAAEGFDPIVAQILAPQAGEAEQTPRGEGGGFLVIERARAARARGAAPLARLVGCWSVPLGSSWPVPASLHVPSTMLLTTVLSLEAEHALAVSPVAACRRLNVLERVGKHEASSAIALVVAASAVAAGEATDALAVHSTPSAVWVTHFQKLEGAP